MKVETELVRTAYVQNKDREELSTRDIQNRKGNKNKNLAANLR